jgi:hypothetical protein
MPLSARRRWCSIDERGKLGDDGAMASASMWVTCVVGAAQLACGGAPPPPPSSPPAPVEPTASIPQNEPVESGRDCVKAEGKCGGGVCNVSVKNDCNDAVHCELAITARCEAQGGTSDASGGDRVTVAAHSTGEVDAQVGCSGGQIVRTEVQKLACK